VCFLTRVGGRFTNPGDYIDIRPGVGEWLVDVRLNGGGPIRWEVSCVRQSEFYAFSGFQWTKREAVACPVNGSPVSSTQVPLSGEAWCPWTGLGGIINPDDGLKNIAGALPDDPQTGQTRLHATCDDSARGSNSLRSATYCSATACAMRMGMSAVLDDSTGDLEATLEPNDDAFCYLTEVGPMSKDEGSMAWVRRVATTGHWMLIRSDPAVHAKAACVLRQQAC
jgi:hypothetical protein